MIQARRLFDIPYYQLETYPRSDMFVTKTNGEWFGVSIQQFLEEAMCVSRGLIAFGVAPGDTVALVSNNRVEWNIMDIAIQQIGAIVVPLYPNISENDYRYILNDAKVKMCFVGNSELCTKIQNIRNSVPSLEHLFSFEIIASCPNWKRRCKIFSSRCPEYKTQESANKEGGFTSRMAQYRKRLRFIKSSKYQR